MPESRPGRKHNANILDDFWSKVVKGSYCWEWTAAKDEDGYGFFWWKNKQVRAHRFSAEHFGGLSVGGIQVLHTCDNPSCVNPKHLFVGTNADNMRDKNEKGRQVRGEGCHKAILKEKDVFAIRRSLSQGVSRKVLRVKYGVSKSTILWVANGWSWKHLLKV